MQFGPVPLSEAEGAILAHSVALPEGRLRKGCILGRKEIAQLQATGRTEVIAARLGADDMHEDEAALAIARALVPDPQAAGLDLRPVGTGRVNLHARAAGVVEVRSDQVNALNAVDPMITLATVPRCQRVGAGEMVATVKIIAYGVAAPDVAAACRAGTQALRLCPARIGRITLVETHTDSNSKVLGVDAITNRLAALGANLATHLHSPHREADLAATLATVTDAELILILTASATSDLHDVAPAAVRKAGGTVDRFGMPVDPGNLLFLGSLNGIPVIGLPGCVRSPALNGADWVMERLICGMAVTAADIAAMGVGGLLKEIPTRGRLREAKPE
ncbi:molybdopterin-binding protein [Tabrizicola sp.]|uniref:molybdopterin-binding protein n=1 Tax=Tabrizicola sp. TaxID=2005166 RepID=UPI002737047A|nr:molybdopterin-binding protein [Tabrizicola sp.]MDP3196413.1 molybdopterin-binding protein [Tabrizicola sp.]